MKARSVERIVTGTPVTDGAGVRITRYFAENLQHRLDPFLLLDGFASDDPRDYLAGFPDHPHRGFETVTYMITGRMRHRDSAGHEGVLENGGIQWMVAGRGIVHSEMPEQENGRMEGFQLWLNLPAAGKMTAPWYRNYQSGDIPEFTTPEGVRVRIVAGESGSSRGAVTRPVTAPIYLDLQLPAGGRFEQPLPPAHHAFVVVYRGDVEIDGEAVRERQMAILGNDGEGVRLSAGAPARALFVAGRPLREPIARHGPFVMNTRAEILAAVRDFAG